MIKKTCVIILITLPILICIGFITALCLLAHKPTPIEVIKRSYNFPGKRITYDREAFEDGRINYLVCDKLSRYICQVEQENYPFKDITRSCDVTLMADGKQRDGEVRVVAFGANRTILLWEVVAKKSKIDTRIAVVHLNDCRKTADYTLYDTRAANEGARFDVKVVTYDDAFDVFYKDPSLCGHQECKLTISEGGRGGQNVGFANNTDCTISDVQSIAAHSTSKGYVYFKHIVNVEGVDLFIMRPGESEKRLASIKPIYQISVVEETIGVCSRANLSSGINCLQYNAVGELKLNATVHLKNSDKYSLSFHILTLPQKGFLLQFSESIKRVGDFVVKVDVTGRQIRKFDFTKYENDGGSGDSCRRVWMNREKKGYCAIALHTYGNRERMDLMSNCFTENSCST